MRGKAREDPALRRALRGVFWGALAAASVATAYRVAVTPEGAARLAQAGGEMRQLAAAVQGVREGAMTIRIAEADRAVLAGGKGSSPLAGQIDAMRQNAELISRKQAETSRRLARIEDQVGTITGSIARADRQPPAPPRLAMFAPDLASPDAGRFEIKPVGPEAPTMGEVQLTRTSFAVATSSASDIDALEQAWIRLQRDFAREFAGLKPYVTFDKTDTGTRLTLLAGPLRNAQDAATICVALTVSGKPCRTVAMSGSVLALNVK